VTLPRTDERADVLDALRGFALLGIFVTHMADFSGYSFLPPDERHVLDRFGLDGPLAAFAEFAVRGKFLSLFAFLFGIGFAVQIDSADRRGADFNRHFIRRLAGLFAIGLLHACVWYGDILKDYALIGLALLLTARWRLSVLARAALAVLLLRFIWPLAVWAFLPIAATFPVSAHPVDEFASLTSAFYRADPIGIFEANLELVRLKALQMIYDGRALSVLGMFLVGALIGRLRLYRESSAATLMMKRVFMTCAPLGVIGNAALVPLHAVTPDFPPTLRWVGEQCLYAIAVPALALAYASGFGLLWARGWWQRVLRGLVPAGRMALTTYVSQTLIGVLLFYGVGLRLGHSVGFIEGTALAVAIFALQCIAARIWLGFFRFGPLEWLWRCATYGTPVEFRRHTVRSIAAPTARGSSTS
jgi:uncharacterized protein